MSGGFFVPGQTIFLTKPDCPSCKVFKQNDDVSHALDTGRAVEVQPGHPEYNRIVEEASIERLPGIVEWTGESYQEI